VPSSAAGTFTSFCAERGKPAIASTSERRTPRYSYTAFKTAFLIMNIIIQPEGAAPRSQIVWWIEGVRWTIEGLGSHYLSRMYAALLSARIQLPSGIWLKAHN